MIEGELRTDATERVPPGSSPMDARGRVPPGSPPTQRTSRRTAAQGQTIIWYNLRVMTMRDLRHGPTLRRQAICSNVPLSWPDFWQRFFRSAAIPLSSSAGARLSSTPRAAT